MGKGLPELGQNLVPPTNLLKRSPNKYLCSRSKSTFLSILQSFIELEGETNADVLNCFVGLGGASIALKKYSQAEEYYNRALSGYRTTMGERHPRTLNAMNGLAGLLIS